MSFCFLLPRIRERKSGRELKGSLAISFLLKIKGFAAVQYNKLPSQWINTISEATGEIKTKVSKGEAEDNE